MLISLDHLATLSTHSILNNFVSITKSKLGYLVLMYRERNYSSWSEENWSFIIVTTEYSLKMLFCFFSNLLAQGTRLCSGWESISLSFPVPEALLSLPVPKALVLPAPVAQVNLSWSLLGPMHLCAKLGQDWPGILGVHICDNTLTHWRTDKEI